jgi:ribosomal-protein-alanine N-acetyltransferase
MGLGFLTLEVRERNAAAINMYKEAGFTEAGRRPGYYNCPVEDAILMTLWLNREY